VNTPDVSPFSSRRGFFFNMGDVHKMEIDIAISNLHGEYGAHSQSLDGFSEIAPSESGISQ